RAVRSARLHHPRADAGMAPSGARRRAPNRAARHARRRRSAAVVANGRGHVGATRPRRHGDRRERADRRAVAPGDRDEPRVHPAEGIGAGGDRVSAKASEERAAEAIPAPASAPKRMSGWVRFWRTYGLAILFVLMILVIWELWIRIFDVPKYLLASPTGIVTAFQKDWSRYLLPNLWPTLSEVLIGFGISVVAGVGLAIVLHLFAPLRRAVYPILIGSQTIPIVVLAPVLVILLGYGLLPKVVIVALICFFPIVVNGLDGLRLVDDDFIRMMRTLDATR